MKIGKAVKRLLPFPPKEGPPVPQVAPEIFGFLREVNSIERSTGKVTEEEAIQAAEKHDLPPLDKMGAKVFLKMREFSTDLGLERVLLQTWGALPEPIKVLEEWRRTHKSILQRIFGD